MAQKKYVNSVAMAENIMSTPFPWIQTLCEWSFDRSKHYAKQRFDGSINYVNRVSMAGNLRKPCFDGSNNYVNSVPMAPSIMFTAFRWLTT